MLDDKWQTAPSLLHPIAYGSGGFIDNQIAVFGGNTDDIADGHIRTHIRLEQYFCEIQTLGVPMADGIVHFQQIGPPDHFLVKRRRAADKLTALLVGEYR